MTRHPLQESQHAYQGGKSTETALHSLVTKIECSQEKQFALAVFMDIQGAFDSTTFAAIQEALESRDVGRTAIRWIVNMSNSQNWCRYGGSGHNFFLNAENGVLIFFFLIFKKQYPLSFPHT